MRVNAGHLTLPLLLVAALPGAQRVVTADRQVIIVGSVADAVNQAPIAGAAVTVGSVGTATGADGRFTLHAPVRSLPAKLTVRARRVGFQPAEQTVVATGDTVKVSFALQASPLRLEGLVVTGADAKAHRAVEANAGMQLTGPTNQGYASDGRLYGGRTAIGLLADTSAVNDACIAAATCPGSTEAYDPIAENPFLSVRSAPRSTFSIDVDRASYSNVRRFILGGTLPPRDAVRIEELVNYFSYENARPNGRHPIAVATEVISAPWEPAHLLLRVSLQTTPVDVADLPPSNLVFLIDVSGSMAEPNKLPLVKQSLRLLVDQLRSRDRVSLVVYAGSAGLVLPSTSGGDKTKIIEAIERLDAGGSTAGGEGIKLAYDVARRNFLRGGNNRVILATDGDFNVGVSSDAELVELIENKRKEGTYLTVLGFGMGNYKDAKLEKLADKGNGNYAYIDDLAEARKTLVHEMGGTLLTVAKDVKLQLEFNPARVRGYRLLGYENRLLRDEDFRDDTKDAGEIGAGHAVTALYEIVPVGARSTVQIREVDSLRYQTGMQPTPQASTDELLHVALRYKPPTSEQSIEMTHVVPDRMVKPSTDFTFAAAVAEFGLLLRRSPHAGKASMENVIASAERARGRDEFGYRRDFVQLAKRAEVLMRAREVVSR